MRPQYVRNAPVKAMPTCEKPDLYAQLLLLDQLLANRFDATLGFTPKLYIVISLIKLFIPEANALTLVEKIATLPAMYGFESEMEY